MYPNLGKAGSPYARTVKPLAQQPVVLPDPATIFDGMSPVRSSRGLVCLSGPVQLNVEQSCLPGRALPKSTRLKYLACSFTLRPSLSTVSSRPLDTLSLS